MNSEPATVTEPATGSAATGARAEPPAGSAATEARSSAAWLCGMLQAGDSFYPTGSYAHSFGLEGMAQLGVVRDRQTLREFLFRSVLPALRHTELPLARHAWTAFEVEDWSQVGELCRLSSALKTAREARMAAENIGRQRAELVASLHDSSLARDYLRKVVAEDWPFSPAISAALEGRVLGAPLVAVLSGITYSTVAGVLSAAMKLLRLGQSGCQSLLTEALRETPALIGAAESVTFDEIGWFNPWLDIAAARHESADTRMFIS